MYKYSHQTCPPIPLILNLRAAQQLKPGGVDIPLFRMSLHLHGVQKDQNTAFTWHIVPHVSQLLQYCYTHAKCYHVFIHNKLTPLSHKKVKPMIINTSLLMDILIYEGKKLI